MKKMRKQITSVAAISLTMCLGLASALPAGAQSADPTTRFVEVAGGYRLVPNITYLRAGGLDLKLDLYQARGTEAAPVIMYFHGGGWTNGSKESSALTFLPYLEMGWSVINVEYRMADVAHAPAAVEDCRCALRWIYRNAEQYGFDINQIVVTGNSAGGHLALTTGMVTASAGLDRQCPGDRNRAWSTGTTSTDELKVAAIINWYGITDVVGLMQTPPGSSGNFTEAWLGGRDDRAEIARRVSPLTYVRAGLPPVLTIHGDADPIVPYGQGVRLHRALDAVGVPNQLLTIAGGGHGGFNRDENLLIYSTIREFLSTHELQRTSLND